MAEVNGAARPARGAAGRPTVHSQERLEEEPQTAAEAAQARHAIPYASPWSGLHWLLEDETLEQVLFPVD